MTRKITNDIQPVEITPENIKPYEPLRQPGASNPFSVQSRGKPAKGEDYAFYDTPDTRSEIKRLLEFNGMDYEPKDEGFLLTFSSGAKKWRTLIVAQENFAIICGEYPFLFANYEMGAALCSKINEQLVTGCAFVSGKSLVFKTAADIFDGYYAYEAIARALEYNAGAILHYWETVYSYTRDMNARAKTDHVSNFGEVNKKEQ